MKCHDGVKLGVQVRDKSTNLGTWKGKTAAAEFLHSATCCRLREQNSAHHVYGCHRRSLGSNSFAPLAARDSAEFRIPKPVSLRTQCVCTMPARRGRSGCPPKVPCGVCLIQVCACNQRVKLDEDRLQTVTFPRKSLCLAEPAERLCFATRHKVLGKDAIFTFPKVNPEPSISTAGI